jgi:hypothetical protein
MHHDGHARHDEGCEQCLPHEAKILTYKLEIYACVHAHTSSWYTLAALCAVATNVLLAHLHITQHFV